VIRLKNILNKHQIFLKYGNTHRITVQVIVCLNLINDLENENEYEDI